MSQLTVTRFRRNADLVGNRCISDGMLENQFIYVKDQSIGEKRDRIFATHESAND